MYDKYWKKLNFYKIKWHEEKYNKKLYQYEQGKLILWRKLSNLYYKEMMSLEFETNKYW